MSRVVLSLIVIFVIPIFLISPAFGGTWGNYLGDQNWNDGGNWTDGVIPADEARIRGFWSGSGFPIVQDANVPDIGIVRCAIDTPGTAQMTVRDGADLTVISWLRCGNYETSIQDPMVRGELYMEGGSLTVNGYIEVGHARSEGLIEMTGGTITVNELRVPGSWAAVDGLINLGGGLIDAGALVFNNNNSFTPPYAGTINVAGGALRVLGSIDPLYLSRGYIVAYDGQGSVIVDTTSQPGYTVITGWIANPKQADSPVPTGTDIDIWTDLSWTAGQGAISHDIYIGEDSGNMVALATGYTSLVISAGDLKANTQYFWRVDEYDGSITTTGSEWSFTTGESAMIDDFEDYDGANLIASAWVASGGGSVSVATDPVTWNSTQAMQLNFNNTSGSYLSQAQLTYALSQDWTRSYVEGIIILFHGDENNSAEQMQLTLEDAAGHSATLAYDGDASDLIQYSYEAYDSWHVDLAEFASSGVSLSTIKKIAIGVGDGTPGTSGVIYIDDMRAYPATCIAEFADGDLDGDCIIDDKDLAIFAEDWLDTDTIIYPVVPPSLNLLAHWKFEGNSNDETGNYNGVDTSVNYNMTGGFDGAGCANFAGSGYVSVSDAAGLFSSITDQITISVWVNGDAAAQPNDNVIFHGSDAAHNGHNPMSYMPTGDGNVTFEAGHVVTQEPGWDSWYYGWEEVLWYDSQPSDWEGQWVHYGFVKDASAGVMQIYRDGELIAEQTDTTVGMAGTEFFVIGSLEKPTYHSLYYKGSLDDFRIYDLALSQAEILSLAGKSSLNQPLRSAADFDENQKVDFADFADLAANWLDEILWPF